MTRAGRSTRATRDDARKELARYGKRGEWVRVFVARELGLVRVQWKEKGSPKISGTESWPDTKENRATAVAWASGRWERMIAGVATRESEMTLLEIWQAFADDQFPHLRPKTRQLYTEEFQRWMTFHGETFLADRATKPMVAQFRTALAKRGYAINTMRKTIETVRRVHRWAKTNDLITANRVQDYVFKVAKEDRPTPPEEYSPEEFKTILGAFDPSSGYRWRAFVAWALIGVQGVRQIAALHVQLDDVELGHAEITGDGAVRWVYGRITWRAEWDKLGNEWSQPLRLVTQIALEIALEWRERMGYTGPWLLPPAQPTRNKGDTYDHQSLWWAIRRAEERTGVPHRKWRAGHGARRMVSNDVAGATGDMLLGLRAIGDKDPKRAVEYIQNRDDRTLNAFAQLDGLTPSPLSKPLQRRPGRSPNTGKRNQNETQPREAAASGPATIIQPIAPSEDN